MTLKKRRLKSRQISKGVGLSKDRIVAHQTRCSARGRVERATSAEREGRLDIRAANLFKGFDVYGRKLELLEILCPHQGMHDGFWGVDMLDA